MHTPIDFFLSTCIPAQEVKSACFIFSGSGVVLTSGRIMATTDKSAWHLTSN